mmetsp:Transcript_63392/g.200271  ORF Transcript_63392/g.200271 Transcript_63392/m.200271 type:complete len:216 (+) Transcript_63392:849-1496(+)
MLVPRRQRLRQQHHGDDRRSHRGEGAGPEEPAGPQQRLEQRREPCAEGEGGRDASGAAAERLEPLGGRGPIGHDREKDGVRGWGEPREGLEHVEQPHILVPSAERQERQRLGEEAGAEEGPAAVAVGVLAVVRGEQQDAEGAQALRDAKCRGRLARTGGLAGAEAVSGAPEVLDLDLGQHRHDDAEAYHGNGESHHRPGQANSGMPALTLRGKRR